MAKRLTDKDKKKIIADYIENQNFSETARINNVDEKTVRRIIKSQDEEEMVKKTEQKKEENTKSVLEEMEKKRAKKLQVLNNTLDFMNNKLTNANDIFTDLKGASTTYGIIMDKEIKLEELRIKKQELRLKTQELENQSQIDKPIIYIPAKDMTKSFVDLNRDIDNRKYLEYWLEGGRGSTKSSFVSEKFIELIENNPKMCGIAIRKVGNTLKDSVFSQLQWAIGQLEETYPNISKDYKITKSPLEITKKSTGQVIYFRGADDPVKIKSIKPPKDMYIGVIWYEEFDQMDGMNAVRKIDQSVMRGGDDFVVFRSYNTPPSTQHFVNKEKKIPKANRKVYLSDYRAVPKEWLGQPFFDEAEYLKETNPQIYENEYLGIETGDGTNVFNNIVLREITDKEIEQMDRLYFGIDFGWYPDPLAYTKCYFNANTRELYILDEYVVNKKSNREVWDYLVENKGVTEEDMIIADSAEPKSIGDFRMYGSTMRGAEKGPDSVPYSMKWLASLKSIIIDAKRTTKCMEEFCNYEYEKDKDGNVISGYPDKDNHCIDSVRYALNNIWKRRGK